MITFPRGASRHKLHASRSTVRAEIKRGGGVRGLNRYIEAMPTDQAEVVGEYMAI